MKFQRFPFRQAHTPGATPRRLAAARKAIQAQLDKVPLFPELVTIQDPEERIAIIDSGRIDNMAERRRDIARNWWRARRILRGLFPAQRESLLRWWNECGHANGTGGPVGLIVAADQLLMGKFDPDGKLREIERCRVLGRVAEEVAASVPVPLLPGEPAKERFFVKLHVARQISQGRRPELFPPLEGEGDVLNDFRIDRRAAN